MYKRILVPTDGSDITVKAVRAAIDLAKLSGAQLSTISVKEPFPYSAISEMQPVPPQEFYDAQERIAASRVKAVQDAASAAGLTCQGHTVEALHAVGGHPRPRQEPAVRPDRDGLARPARRQRAAAGQRDAARAHAQPVAGAGGQRSSPAAAGFAPGQAPAWA